MQMITVPEMQSLSTDGYLILHDAISLETVRSLLEDLSDLAPSHAHRNLLAHPTVQSFAYSDQTRRLIEPTLGSSARPVRAILFDKLPGANWKVAWHQDLSIAVKAKCDLPGYGPWSVKENTPHVQPPAAILEQMLTLRLHLDDCLDDNGPVRILPGSHRHGILTPARIQSLRQQIPEVAATTRAGGVLLMRPLLLHASSPAANPDHRRVVHIEYAAATLPAGLEWFEQ